MAWLYMMAIRCPNEWAARAIADRYAGQTFTFVEAAFSLLDNTLCKFRTEAKGADDEWWVEIFPSNVTRSGISTPVEASRANQFCNVMYGMLRNEPSFDYALADVECQEFRTLDELKKDLVSGFAQRFDGLVVSNELLAACGNPEYFTPFSPTHQWVPKQLERPAGETWSSGVQD